MAAVRVGLGVFVMNSAGTHFVVGVRGNQTGIGKGTLSLPGGHLEVGETFEECARREVLEETGLQIDHLVYATAVNNRFADGRHYITIFMTSTVTGEEQAPKNLEPTKCDGWSWMKYDELIECHRSTESNPVKLFLPLTNLIEDRPEFDPSSTTAM